ncbi:phage integrase SAM-like domain-containing protein [Aestuariivivens marinum]|uniref:phage integrase SAM-like domain-containing protein n=1 Tax=Aestuariivivens marinum TaxID=2913555 RepID=UPI001F57403A|nr:phage integrase SAM-like domain-containing protein [Aestuariivivens marinum]
MATVKYLLQSKSENAPIYLRLSVNRDLVIKRKTGLYINPENWSNDKSLPKQTYADPKNITSDLRKLKGYILDEVNESNSNGIEITGDWLQSKIDLHFNKHEVVELDYLTEYGEYFINNLKYKVNAKSKGVGVSNSTQKKYRTIVNKLIDFDKKQGKRTKLTDVNLSFRSDLIDYFNKVDKLSDNTIGRYLKFVKSICLDAKKNGFRVSTQLNDFLGFTVKAPKIILTPKELEILKNKEFSNNNHNIARDWLIIGCYTGQRVSDLLRMEKSFIQHIQDHDFIVLEQIKTKKTVQIPIHYEVRGILNKRNGEFPPTFANNMDSCKAMFNRYLKELCKLAEIDTIVNGNKFDEKKKRYINGNYPKHELVSSHICRRSFASNFYASELYPTPILMNITAHSTEKMFLEYIGKKPIDYSLQLAEIWQKEGLKQKRLKEQASTLELIKDASNQN